MTFDKDWEAKARANHKEYCSCGKILQPNKAVYDSIAEHYYCSVECYKEEPRNQEPDDEEMEWKRNHDDYIDS